MARAIQSIASSPRTLEDNISETEEAEAVSSALSPRSDPEVSQFSPPLWPWFADPAARPAAQWLPQDPSVPGACRRFLGRHFETSCCLLCHHRNCNARCDRCEKDRPQVEAVTLGPSARNRALEFWLY